jgi:hypothetical protein
MDKNLIRNIAILAVVYFGGVYVYKMMKKKNSSTTTSNPSGAQPEASFSNMSAKWECPVGEDKYQISENQFYCKPKGYTNTHNSRKVERAPVNG